MESLSCSLRWLIGLITASVLVFVIAWWLPWRLPCGFVRGPYQLLVYFPCKQPPITKLWVFGGSTVDTGWFHIAPYSGEMKFDNYISNPSLGVGRPVSSPGLMSVEVLANALGASTPTAPQNQSGTNYATGGARDAQTNTTETGGFPNAVPTITQIQNYLSAHQPGAQDLFLISSGDNDVAYALNNAGFNQTAYVQQQAQSLAGAIQSLQQRGAQFIMVVGLPESFGSPQEKQILRAAHGVALQAALTQLNVSYVWANLNGLRKSAEQYNGSISLTASRTISVATPRAVSPCPPRIQVSPFRATGPMYARLRQVHHQRRRMRARPNSPTTITGQPVRKRPLVDISFALQRHIGNAWIGLSDASL